MHSTRRTFLKAAAPSLLSLSLGTPHFLARAAQAAAAGSKHKERILVVVQLGGGNDGLNTIVPYADDIYRKSRPILGLGQPQVLKIDNYLGFHNRLSGFQKLYEAKRLAVVQGVGYPHPDRSHFRSMDIWHSARPDIAKPADGWLGRAVDGGLQEAAHDVPALNLGGNKLPLALESQRRPLPSVDSLENFQLRTSDGALPLDALRQLAAAPRAGAAPTDDLLAFMQRSSLAAYDSSRQVQQVLGEQKSPVNYPGFNLARKLQSIAQLIDAGLSTRIYYVTLDGFDTHANQAGGHAALLGELGDSLTAFADDLAARGQLDRVMLLSFSEFGRRVHENASRGTDHGAAAPLFLVGGKVAAGLIGKHPSLKDLDNEGDLKFHTDFRQVYAALLDGWLGCSSEAVLGQKFATAPVLKA